MYQIKIAICDDEKHWQDKAKEIIRKTNEKVKRNIETYTFDQGERLLDVVINRKDYMDIIILDIDMPGLNGFEIAEQIKTAYPDALLLFYTSHAQYVYDSLQFQPFRYIRKEFADKELPSAVVAAINAVTQRNDTYILLKAMTETRMVRIDDIVYFETNKRRCNVILSDGNVLDVRKTIKELQQEINNDFFVQIHSGVVVNVKYIKSFSPTDVTLDNDTHLTISRSRITAIKETIMNYWGQKL